MSVYQGWLLDVYADRQEGVVVWLLGEDGQRHRFRHHFAVTFYAAGPVARLRALWRYLGTHSMPTSLARTQRRDLFAGMQDVMAIHVANAALQPALFRDVWTRFPDLDYYDADVPLALRFGAAYELFPLAFCRVSAGVEDVIQTIEPLESRWELDPAPPPLRILTITPDVDPAHADPTQLIIKTERNSYSIPLAPARLLPIQLQASLLRHDPDLVLTRWGDTWLFPHLLDICRREQYSFFNPNRDRTRQVLQRRENSYFTYGQVVYRGHQVHLFGRWHLDQQNGVMYGEYGLTGVLEQARVTGLPVQEVARKSPGAGITAMQIQAALRAGILVPYQKQQAERFKTARELIRADRGGLVYQPLLGLHADVAEIDFVSMYPSIMVHANISPETMGDTTAVSLAAVDRSREGLVPRTLRPLLARRVAIKQRLATLTRRDCRYGPLQARATALKWLLVVSFGYLGYKNARFGRIESHEAVTAYGREALLRAKEAAEDLGFVVLHMYVDGLWVQRQGVRQATDIQPLLDEITARTGLPIALEGIYRWIAFLPSRQDSRVPVANRYFGIFNDGTLKIRGIAARRRDTPPFVAETQIQILQHLARVPAGQPLPHCLPAVLQMLRRRLHRLRSGKVPLEELLVRQSLSRPLDEYRVPSAAARAALQLQAAGKRRRPGQPIRFLYMRGDPGVYAWDLPGPPDPAVVDGARYTDLFIRAAHGILQIFDLPEETLRSLLLADTRQLLLPPFAT